MRSLGIASQIGAMRYVANVAALKGATDPYYVAFDGTSSLINCGDDSNLRGIHDSSFTIDLWARVHAYPTFFPMLIEKMDSNVAAFGWDFYVNHASDILVGDVSWDTDAFSESVETITLNTWQHLLMTFDTSDKKIYFAIDGVWCTYSTQTAATGTDAWTDVGANVIIGGVQESPAYTGTLDGDISWLRISSGIRYAIGVGFTPPARCAAPAADGTTIELWKLDEGAGITAMASLDMGDNGVITAGTWHLCT